MNEENKSDNRLLKFGIVGTGVAALCCFTPILVVLVGVVGLSAITGYLDYVLFPALGFFILLTIYALWRKKRCTQIASQVFAEGDRGRIANRSSGALD